MKFKKSRFLCLMAASTLCLFACNTQPQTANGSKIPDESKAPTPLVYRGSVVNVNADGSIEVAQVPGFNYEQESVIFSLDANAVPESESGIVLAKDAFVEVYYSGVLTRSIPPKGVATSIYAISAFTDGIVKNGTIKSAEKTSDGFSLEFLPLEAEDTPENIIVLTVPENALEGLNPPELVAGVKISAVTRGISTMSLPPQMPVIAVMPMDSSLG